MINLFSSPSKSYLGVDIGSAGIKMVELKDENGRPRLVTYGFAEEPVDIIRQTSPQMQNRMAEILKKITEKCKSDEEFIAVEMIIASIVVVENVFKGKGQEILKGAHVVFGDPELFNYLKNNAQTRDRISSHYKKTLIE